jgi:hypothetical protein
MLKTFFNSYNNNSRRINFSKEKMNASFSMKYMKLNILFFTSEEFGGN